MGGIQKGGGGLIHGKDLNEMGRMAEDLKKGLELAANELKKGENVSEKALKLISKLPISNKMYRAMGNIGWRTQALGNWNVFNMKDKPYEE
jgi:hypothetical protein